MSRVRRQGGFTLIETLIALTLIAVALLLAMALLLQQPRVVKRVDAELAAMHAIEATLELIRSGGRLETTPPDQSALLGGALRPLQTAGGGVAEKPSPSALTVDVKVVPLSFPDPPNLYRVTLRARYKIYGNAVVKQVETLVWRPGQP